jgi:Lrp/AsnC family transcriptional regulator for asnA, asnC and gidA
MPSGIKGCGINGDSVVISFDELDIGIISHLHKDARAPVKTIAEKLGMPESTVRHRLGRLVEAGAVEFVALTNPLNLGRSVWVMMEIEVKSRRIRQVALDLSKIPEVYFVYINTGGFDIFAGATFSTNKELVDFLTNVLSKVDGIVRVSTRSILEVHKRVFKFLPKASEKKTKRKAATRRRQPE